MNLLFTTIFTSALAQNTSHLHPIIKDLGLILLTAGVAVLLFKKIKQPLVLGYLIAGFLASGNFRFFPSVTDQHSVEVWAEIGVIFLLFSLGLEFSFKKLMKVGGTASITAITQIISMICLGYLAGQWMGWKPMDSIFLGAILAVSSTTIIIRAFEELNVKSQKFAGIVFGALIVEDIVAIVLMVLLSTIAVSQQFSGYELFLSVLKLVFFLIIWFIAGIFFIPTLLKKAKNLLTDEMILIISIALCLMMVILAAGVGFSPALGAFIMGSIIAETTQAERIEHLVKPVKDLFGAIFFVSVGMLINVATLYEYALPVAIITLITIFGKAISSTTGALLSGQPLKQSIQTGMSLGQIGEFSFIIATLGMSLNVTSDFLYPIVVAVSAVTTFTTPFLIKYSTPLSEYVEKNMPKKWLNAIHKYSSNTEAIKSVNHWQKFLKAALFQVIINSVIIIALTLLSSKFLLPLLNNFYLGDVIAALITIMVLAPFFWALSFRKVAMVELQEILKERKYKGPFYMIAILRMTLAVFYLGFLLNLLLPPVIAFIALIIAVIVYMMFKKRINQQYYWLENHFMSNFNAREIVKAGRSRRDLIPWDGHMTTFEIAKESNLAGKSLKELKLREELGINVAFIKRGEITINIPTRNDRLFPGDEICVIGTDMQVQDFKAFLDKNESDLPEAVKESDIILAQYELMNHESVGKTIRESNIREKTHGLIVGLERNKKRILNPESHIVLNQADILWIVGSKKLLNDFFKDSNTH